MSNCDVFCVVSLKYPNKQPRCRANLRHYATRDITSFSHPSAAYMHQGTGLALVQIMACRMFGTKPLLETTLTYCQLDPQEQSSGKYEAKYEILYSWKCTWECRMRNGGHFISREKSINIYASKVNLVDRNDIDSHQITIKHDTTWTEC